MKIFTIMLFFLIMASDQIQAIEYKEITAMKSKLEQKFSIKIYLDNIPKSIWRIDYVSIKKGDLQELYDYLIRFDEEFSKYPLSFIKKTKLKGIVLVKYLSIERQPRSAIPDYLQELLYFDINMGKIFDEHQRGVIHHEFYHMIEEEINNEVYWKDPEWIKLNEPNHKYGAGGQFERNNSAGNLTQPKKGFMNQYSLSGLEEDKAEIFTSLFISYEYNKLLTWSYNDIILANKINYMKNFLIKQDTNFHMKYWKNLHQ